MTNDEMKKIADTIGNDGKWNGGSAWLIGSIGGAGTGTLIAVLTGFGTANVVSVVSVGGILGFLGVTTTIVSSAFCPAVLIPVAIISALIGGTVVHAHINDAYKQGIRIGGIDQAKKDKLQLERTLGRDYFVQIRETEKGADLIVSKEEIIDLKNKDAMRNAFVVAYNQ